MTALMGGTRALPLVVPFMLLNAAFDRDEDEPWDAEAAWGEFLRIHLVVCWVMRAVSLRLTW